MIWVITQSLGIAFGIQAGETTTPCAWFYPCGHAILVITEEDIDKAWSGCVCKM